VLRASGLMSSQNIHMLASSRGDIVNDMWVPATNKLTPESGWQTSGGIAYSLGNHLQVSADAFYREMHGVVEYNEGGVNVLFGRDWEKAVTGGGLGRAYGAEFFLSGEVGNFSAWAKYNLGWSDRKFDKLNGGKTFPFKYDRRHDVSIVLMYKINKHWDVSMSWVYGSGNRITVQQSQYASAYTINNYQYYISNNLPIDNRYTAMVATPTDRNNFRLPAFHHLDLGLNYYKQRKRCMHQLNISIYNIYNRLNVFTVFSDTKLQPDGTYKTSYRKLSLFPFLPSFTYIVHFD